MTDEYDYDYGWEPTDEELVAVYIADDAADPDLELLAWRQAQRWEGLMARVQGDIERTEESLKKAKRGGGPTRPTWWKLWSPPELKETGGKPADEDPRIIKQGDLCIRHELKTRDVYSMYGDEHRPIRLTEDYTIWMEFEPDPMPGCTGFPDLRFLNQQTITSSSLHGKWGWWDCDKGVFRSRIHGAVTYRDEDHPELGVTDFAVQMIEPPPYGLWLPTIVNLQGGMDA